MRYSQPICIGLLLIILSYSVGAAYAQEPEKVGYSIVADSKGIKLQAVDESGGSVGDVVSFPQFRLEDVGSGIWNITRPETIVLSPDMHYFALTATDNGMDTALFLYSFEDGMLQQQGLSSTADEVVRLIWSPDSSALLIEMGYTAAKLFDVNLGQVLNVTDTAAIRMQWLPDSTKFIYVGLAVCADQCYTSYDLYMGNRLGVNTTALTSLNVEDLGLQDHILYGPIYPSNFVYSQFDERVYFTVGDIGKQEQDIVETLYSVDLLGSLRFETDLLATYPDYYYNSDIQDMYSRDDGTIYFYSQVETVDDPDSDFVWSVFSYRTDNSVQVISEKQFSGLEDLNLITSVSTDNELNYLALGGADPSLSQDGGVFVVNLQTGEVELDIDTSEPVCNVNVQLNSVIYTQSVQTERSCVRYTDNQSGDQLIATNLTTDVTTTIDAASGTSIFLLPPS